MTFNEFLNYFDFEYKKYPDGYGLIDTQKANLGDIEDERFGCAGEMVERLADGIYGEDYLDLEDKNPEKGSYEYYVLHPEELEDTPPSLKNIQKIYEDAADKARKALIEQVRKEGYPLCLEVSQSWCSTPHVLTAICFTSEDEKKSYIGGTFEKGKHFPSVFVNVDDYFTPNEYYKTSDGWFDFYVNKQTGKRKLHLEDGDTLIEAPKRDDFYYSEKDFER